MLTRPSEIEARKSLAPAHNDSRMWKILCAISTLVNILAFAALGTFIGLYVVKSDDGSSKAPTTTRVHSVPMMWANASGSRNGTVGSRRRRLYAKGGLEGAAYADYAVDVKITDGSSTATLRVIVDSGSSTFAVAASAGDGCMDYYPGTCNGASCGVNYGTPSDPTNWSGHVCSGASVTLEGLSAGTPDFGGIQSNQGFLNDCSSSGGGPISEGILGMAYASLAEAPLTTPLFDSIVDQNSDIANIFSMQCCSWNGHSAGTGTLVLGGSDSSLYSGSLQYTAVTSQTYYCVSMSSATTSSRRQLGTKRELQYSYSYGGEGDPDCTTIIDSGTSAILLTSDYADVTNQMPSSGTCVTDSEISSYPDIILTFPGYNGAADVVLTVPPSRYLQPSSSGCRQLMVSQTSGSQNIIGQAMMEEYYTEFDRVNNRVGFAPLVQSKC